MSADAAGESGAPIMRSRGNAKVVATGGGGGGGGATNGISSPFSSKQRSASPFESPDPFSSPPPNSMAHQLFAQSPLPNTMAEITFSNDQHVVMPSNSITIETERFANTEETKNSLSNNNNKYNNFGSSSEPDLIPAQSNSNNNINNNNQRVSERKAISRGTEPEWDPKYDDLVWVQTHPSFPYWPAYICDPGIKIAQNE